MTRMDDVQTMFARRRRTVRDIQRAVADHYGLTVGDIVGRSQARGRCAPDVCGPRGLGYFLARRHTTASTTLIGQRFGGRDHSTVIKAVKIIEAKLANDSRLAAEIQAIEATL